MAILQQNLRGPWRLSWSASNSAIYLIGDGSVSTTRPLADAAPHVSVGDADYLGLNVTLVPVSGTLPADWTAAGARASIYARGVIGSLVPGRVDWETDDGTLGGGADIGGVSIFQGSKMARGQHDLAAPNTFVPLTTETAVHGFMVHMGGPISPSTSNANLAPLAGIGRIAYTIALQPATADSITAELDVYVNEVISTLGRR